MYRKRSVGWTIGLSIGLFLIITLQIAIFIVGPQLKFEYQQMAIIEQVREDVGEDVNVYRHVFEHIAYTTQDSKYVYWYNNQAELVKKEEVSTLKLSEVTEIANNKGLSNPKINIGYGHDAPAYEVISDDGYMILDYKTLEVIHMRKGS